MAAILNFPHGPNDGTTVGTAPTQGRAARPRERGVPRTLLGVPGPVADAVGALRAMRQPPWVTYREIPVPARMAPYGIGVDMEVHDPAHASGWLMLLHQPDVIPARQAWRCVAYLRAGLTPGEPRPLVPQLYWDMWAARATPALVRAGSAAGTVTVCDNTTFDPHPGPAAPAHVGETAPATSADCEMRISWTPAARAASEGPEERLIDAAGQVGLWTALLRDAAAAASG